MSLWAAIPGETPIDVSGLKLKGVRNRDELSIVEAENIRKAMLKYLGGTLSRRSARFDLEWMMKLHKEMFGDVWTWAGSTRTIDLNLGVPWQQVQTQMENLCGDLAYWNDHWDDVIEQTVHLHHRAAQIHPFLNGNGRWARLLANIWLKLNKQPITVWPDDSISKTSPIRNDYLTAMRAADLGDFTLLMNLHNTYSSKS